MSVPGGGAATAAVAVSRCLVYLGDLCRYAALHTPGPAAAKDWAAPASYYAAAVRLCPSGGNPHNQLAVLATYVGDDLSAAYQYARAQACAAPFATARDNLGLLLDKVPPAAAAAAAATPTSAPAAATADAARAAFVAALAAAFARAPNCADAVATALRALDAALASPGAAAALLTWGPAGSPPSALLMLATALCAELTRCWAPSGKGGSDAATAASAASTLLFGTWARLLGRAAAEAAAPPARGAALAVALPLLEWAAAAPADALPAPGAPSSEVRARAVAWECAAALLNALQDAGQHAHQQQLQQQPALAADYELRGMTALASPHAALRFGGAQEYSAATAAAVAGEGADVHSARAARALTAGVRIAAGGGPTGAPPLLRSPSTARFLPAHAGPLTARAVPPSPSLLWGALVPPSQAPYNDAAPAAEASKREPAESFCALIESEAAVDAVAAGLPAAVQPLAPVGAPPSGGSFRLFSAPALAQPPAQPPPLPSSALVSRALQPPGLANGTAAPAQLASSSWDSVFGARGGLEADQPLPFPGLLAAAARAPPLVPPPGACTSQRQNVLLAITPSDAWRARRPGFAAHLLASIPYT